MKQTSNKFLFHFLFVLCFSLNSCFSTGQISSKAKNELLSDSAVSQGFIGISIYNVSTGKYIYEHQSQNYFVPASNTKLITLYAGLKNLKDSLLAAQYQFTYDSSIIIYPTGDPSFLNPEYRQQPLMDFLQKVPGKVYLNLRKPSFEKFGKGWSWDDYADEYMPERSAFPIYGNQVNFQYKNESLFINPPQASKLLIGDSIKIIGNKFQIQRTAYDEEGFSISRSNRAFLRTRLPMKMSNNWITQLLADSLKKTVLLSDIEPTSPLLYIYSQPIDSFFSVMMHRSDNFYADQTLLMVSQQRLGYMTDQRMIDSLLATDLKDMPNKPTWVDGSGLSRYNQFTPRDFVYILQKLLADFGLERMKYILPTGGKGTLRNYYLNDAGNIFAKTGTLSNNCALSGYLITKKNQILIFSVLANNYQTGATPVRRAIEKFLQNVRNTN